MKSFLATFILCFSFVSVADFEGDDFIYTKDLVKAIIKHDKNVKGQVTNEEVLEVVQHLKDRSFITPIPRIEPKIKDYSLDLASKELGAGLIGSDWNINVFSNKNVYEFSFYMRTSSGKDILIPKIVQAELNLGGFLSLAKGVTQNYFYIFTHPNFSIYDFHGKMFGGNSENNTSFSAGIKLPVGGSLGIDLYTGQEMIETLKTSALDVAKYTKDELGMIEDFKTKEGLKQSMQVLKNSLMDEEYGVPMLLEEMVRSTEKNTFIIIRMALGVEGTTSLRPKAKFRVLKVMDKPEKKSWFSF